MMVRRNMLTLRWERKWERYYNGHKDREYVEFVYGNKSWSKFYHAVYTRVGTDEKQRLLAFARPDNLILTNIGVYPTVFAPLVTVLGNKEEE